MENLRQQHDELTQNPTDEGKKELFYRVRELLDRGELRVADKSSGMWITNGWIKTVILWGFKYGQIEKIQSGSWDFFDKDTFPVKNFDLSDKIRLVPGGSSIRSGSYIAEGTVIMPPSYINTGVYLDSGCMVDSHVLIGSCAQIGKNVHISAGTQIGGVLEPAGALPVIVEDNVFIGGNCGIYEGCLIRERAVIATGVILNGSTPVFDNTTGQFIRKENGGLTIPEGAVVIPGSRPLSSQWDRSEGVQIYCPVIIKYRDKGTDASTTLESALR